MKKVLPYKLFLSLILVVCLMPAFGQEAVERSWKKSFRLTDDGEVNVTNKYGPITFNGWDKDSVRVEIQAIGDDEDLLERINPSFDFSREYLVVKTAIEPKSRSYFSQLFRDIKIIDIDKSSLDVIVAVYLPVNAQIKAENKFGDIIINNCKGRMDLKGEHGDIRVNSTVEIAEVNIQFGDFRAYAVERLEAEVNSGGVNISSAGHVQLESSASNIEIDSVETIRIYSERDVIKCLKANTVTGDMRFSELTVDEMSEFGDITMHQSELNVLSIGRFLTSLHLDQKSSDIDIFVGNVGLLVEADLEAGLLRLPRDTQNLNVEFINEDDEIRSVSGQIGSNPKAKLHLKGIDGYMTIRK